MILGLLKRRYFSETKVLLQMIHIIQLHRFHQKKTKRERFRDLVIQLTIPHKLRTLIITLRVTVREWLRLDSICDSCDVFVLERLSFTRSHVYLKSKRVSFLDRKEEGRILPFVAAELLWYNSLVVDPTRLCGG